MKRRRKTKHQTMKLAALVIGAPLAVLTIASVVLAYVAKNAENDEEAPPGIPL